MSALHKSHATTSRCISQLQAASTDLAITTTYQCGSCSVSFSSKRGPSLHQKARHPSLYLEQHETRNHEECKRKNYEKAELILLAQPEIELDESCRFPNKNLADAGIVTRTAEQIRQIRKLQKYRTILSELRERAR